MKVRIGEGADEEEASAVASALAEHLGTDIEVHVRGRSGDGPVATTSPSDARRAVRFDDVAE